MIFSYYYRRIFLSLAKALGILLCIASVFILTLILCDLFFGANWGYPWWAALLVLAVIVISIGIMKVAARALRQI
jgi:hypothetical protein